MHIGLSEPRPADAHADFRQLRHQTKNALARILARVSNGLGRDGSGRRVAAEVERHIILTAQISDALFGLTRSPGRFEERLQMLCEAIAELASDPEQCLRVRCSVVGDLASEDQGTVLRVVHELVENAVKHGMHMRLTGIIAVSVTAAAAGTTVQVVDDGWGCGQRPVPGEGLRVARMLAEEQGGRLALERCGMHTVARLELPFSARVS